jgi:hypothetical protein
VSRFVRTKEAPAHGSLTAERGGVVHRPVLPAEDDRGDYARTAGEILPGALLMPEGSLAANALRYGLLPALSSETAGQLTKGTAAEPWARIAGGILGAGPTAWRDLPGVRSAPRVVEPLGESELSPAEQLAARRRE